MVAAERGKFVYAQPVRRARAAVAGVLGGDLLLGATLGMFAVGGAGPSAVGGSYHAMRGGSLPTYIKLVKSLQARYRQGDRQKLFTIPVNFQAAFRGHATFLQVLIRI